LLDKAIEPESGLLETMSVDAKRRGRVIMLRQFSRRDVELGESADSLAALAMELAEEGDLPGALRLLHRSIERDSDCYRAWLGLFEIFLAIDEPQRAARSLRIARQLRARGPRRGMIGSLPGTATA